MKLTEVIAWLDGQIEQCEKDIAYAKGPSKYDKDFQAALPIYQRDLICLMTIKHMLLKSEGEG